MWADQDHCPFLCPNPRQCLLPLQEQYSVAAENCPERGISGTPSVPSWKGRMTSWHVQQMSTRSLMYLPTPSTPLTATFTPSHHRATVSPATHCLEQQAAHPGSVEELGTEQSSVEDKGFTTASLSPAPAIPRAFCPCPI